MVSVSCPEPWHRGLLWYPPVGNTNAMKAMSPLPMWGRGRGLGLLTRLRVGAQPGAWLLLHLWGPGTARCWGPRPLSWHPYCICNLCAGPCWPARTASSRPGSEVWTECPGRTPGQKTGKRIFKAWPLIWNKAGIYDDLPQESSEGSNVILWLVPLTNELSVNSTHKGCPVKESWVLQGNGYRVKTKSVPKLSTAL